MQRILRFILARRTSLLYLSLSVLCIFMTVESRTYHQSKYFNSSNWVSGQFSVMRTGIGDYFHLKAENERLLEENNRLRGLLHNQPIPIAELDSARRKRLVGDYKFTSARITRNSISMLRNYLTINKGSRDSLKPEMGVISSRGVVGVVENTSGRFATVRSLLNVNSSINAKIQGKDYFGSLVWDGESFMIVQLLDIPRFVEIGVGDSIVTGGMSSIFPENIPIGVIESFRTPDRSSFYEIDVRLHNDMANLRSVYVIENVHQDEVKELEKATENAQ